MNAKRQTRDRHTQDRHTQDTRADELSLPDWIRGLPKAELHLHLEGTLTPATLVELSAHAPSGRLTLAQAEALYRYTDFQGFLMAFKAVTELLRTPEDYELVTYRMIQQLAAQGVVHAEVYVSVGVVYYWRRIEFEPLFAGMERGRIRAEREFGVSIYWLFDAVRHFPVEDAARVFHKAAELQRKHPNIVGIGIGGDEARGPADLFRKLYKEARDNGLHLTAHAGESTGPESVWGALNIGAERIGHGLSTARDGELIEILVERQVPIEICVTSNLRTHCCKRATEHPLRRYFDMGLMVTLNSDDPAMFGSDLAEEYELAHDTFEFTREHLRELAANSVEASFLPPGRKIELLQQIESY